VAGAIQRFGNDNDAVFALAVSPDGSAVFVTGYSTEGATSQDYATVAYDASAGSELWRARYGGPGTSFDSAVAVVVSPDGSEVFITGYSDGGPTRDDYATVAYDASTGAVRWGRRYDGPGHNIDDASSITVTPDGSAVYVTGYSVGAQSLGDYATVAYDAATGSSLWLARYDGPAGDIDSAHAIGVSPDGSKVFVTGHSDEGGSSRYDYATLAYDATAGTALWEQRYDGPFGSDLALSLGVSADGSRVFITGWSAGSNYSDWATVAYEA
jgi:putative pyrroloquinoline-quinone binding quinoprotein